MIRNWFKIILVFLLFSSITGCKNDLGYEREQGSFMNGELLVDVIVNRSNYNGTRTEFNDKGTEFFSEGDMIHIVGVFNISYLDENSPSDEKATGTVSRYGALRYNGKSWAPVAGSELTWPAVATDAKFTAYYVSDNSGILTGSTSQPELYLLSDLEPGSDPLMAESRPAIPYGNAVALNFTHICAFLNLVDMVPMVADEFWFTTDGRVDINTNEKLPFNNAFQIALKEGDFGPELDFQFVQSANTSYNPSVFIVSQKVNDSENPSSSASVGYFLEPGYYPTFKIVYPATENSMYDFLEYDFYNLLENSGGSEEDVTKPDLKANTPYLLSVTKAPGVTITIPPSDNEWDESDNYWELKDVEEFLNAIYKKEGYSEDNVEILQKTATGTLLVKNVDFNNFDYDEFKNKNFKPNNLDGSVFDGGYHYIRNLGSPLFRYNFGTIQNLGIKDVNIELTSYEIDDSSTKENEDMSRIGALCMWNRDNAKINNLRVSDVTLTVNVRSIDEGGQETHNIGGILGSNTGELSDVALSGNFNITVRGENDNDVDASVLIGGIAGQNAGEGKISNVGPLTVAPVFNIINTCQGTLGAFSLGGVVGESQGYITDIIIKNLTIDSSGSQGLTSYIGGLAGQLQVSLTGSSAVNAILDSSNVEGSVIAGQSSPSGALSSVSYTGGLAGTVLNVPVIDCKSTVSVFGPENSVQNVLYGIGGAFGRIREGQVYDFDNVIAYGPDLTYPPGEKSYPGNFAGIAPESQSEEYYNKLNIRVYFFPDVDLIGGFLPPVIAK